MSRPRNRCTAPFDPVRWLPLVFVFWTLSAWPADVSEYQLKLAFLYNFITFTEWPFQENEIFELCIFGKDPFGKQLEKIKGKKIGGRPLATRQTDQWDQLKGCRVVFIARSAEDQLQPVLDAVKYRQVLTVADMPDAAQEGVMLNMAMRKGQVRFDVNLKTARDNGLKLNSKLLRLASEVIQ